MPMEDLHQTGPKSTPLPSRSRTQTRQVDPGSDLDLAGLIVMYGLSIRAFNVCRTAQLDRLSSIRQFKERHGGFHKLRNCGTKTMKELEDLLVQCHPDARISTTSTEEVLSPEQIQQIYLQCFSQLGSRSREALTALTGPPAARAGIDLFLRAGEALREFEDQPSPVRKELRQMRRTLFQELDHRRHALRVEKLKSAGLTLDQWFKFHDLSEFARSQLFAHDGRMTLLRFMDHYLEQFDDHKAYRLLLHRLHKDGYACSTVQLARRFEFTPERVRQILASEEARLRAPFEVIADLPDVKIHYPELLTDGPIFMVTEELIDGLNARDKTQFAPVAVLHIAHAVDPQGLVIGSWTALFGHDKVSNALNNEKLFLIDPHMVEPVQRMIASLSNLLKRKRKNQEGIHAEELMPELDPSLRSRSLSLFKQLVAVRWPELEIRDHQFILPANRMKSNDDRLKELLESLNEPSHVSVILEAWERRFPTHSITAQAISNMVAHKRALFMSIGHTSTYALRNWEKERPGLNTGSIRSMVAALLGSAPMPLHRDDLAKAIKRERPRVTGLGIIHNLKLDKSGTFCFFPGGYVGLARKHYDHVPSPRVNVPGHLLRHTNLVRFIGKTRSDLFDHLTASCDASPDSIECVIDKAVAAGRLVVSAEGVIRSAHMRAKQS